MEYYILDTLEEAEACEREVYSCYIEHSTDQKYIDSTPKWCDVKQRLTDGKYIVPVCNHVSEHGYIVETEQPNWYEEI